MKRALLLVLALSLFCLPGAAQRRDSVYTASEQFKWTKLLVPGTLMGAGTFATLSPWYKQQVNLPVRDWVLEHGAPSAYPFENILQYAPVAAYAVSAALGGGQHSFWEQLMAGGTAALVMGILVTTIKYTAQVQRPCDGPATSFPSGHTATAFMGAELIRLEYGPWWGLAAYSAATLTAVMRVWHNWHWTSDLLGGAALGILGAQVGYWLLPWERKLLRVDSAVQGHVLPYAAPTPAGVSYGLTLAVQL